jgi:uracil phosphoribosyltransferase
MIATAGTAIAAVNILKDWGLKKIVFVSILASQHGVAMLQEAHPDLDIYTAKIDDELTEEGYVFPGVGDAGDRLFKTLH